jgi:hypothetical protein
MSDYQRVDSMRRYVITCDFHNPRQNNGALDKHVRLIDPSCEHPHNGVWVIRSVLAARELRHNLLMFLDPEDKLFVCEAGLDMAGFNAIAVQAAAPPRNVVPFTRRNKSSMLTSVFSVDGSSPRMLTGATGGNLQ